MKDDDFARRLAQACDRHESVPAYGFGRQTWIKDKMHVSHEAVRKWARGETRPRPKKMKELAHLLGVDEAWLSLGVEPDFSPTEKKARGVTLEGVAQVFMGLLQAGGGGVAFAGAAGIRRRIFSRSSTASTSPFAPCWAASAIRRRCCSGSPPTSRSASPWGPFAAVRLSSTS